MASARERNGRWTGLYRGADGKQKSAGTGIAATVLANVAFGARYGLVGAAISAWPGVSFVVATEILLGQMRRAGGISARDGTALTVAAVTVPSTCPAAYPPACPWTVR